MAVLLGNHSCFIWLDYKLHKGKERKTRPDVEVQSRFGIATDAGPRSLDAA